MEVSKIDLLATYERLLGEGECSIINRANEMIDRGTPDPELKAQCRVYGDQNDKMQRELAHLESQLRGMANIKWMYRCQVIAETIEELKNEGYRAQGERGELIYRDERARNSHDVYTQLDQIANYVNSLGWILKGALKRVEAKY